MRRAGYPRGETQQQRGSISEDCRGARGTERTRNIASFQGCVPTCDSPPVSNRGIWVALLVGLVAGFATAAARVDRPVAFLVLAVIVVPTVFFMLLSRKYGR